MNNKITQESEVMQQKYNDIKINRNEKLLLETFDVHPQDREFLCSINNVNSLNELVEQHIDKCMAFPDEEIYELVLPTLMKRLQNNIKRMKENLWIQ